MIQKTPEEKAAIKAAKKSWKENGYDRPSVKMQQRAKETTPKEKPILTGLLEGEEILPDDFPVVFGYLYVMDDHGGRVVSSDVEGTVKDLKRDLQRCGYDANNIYNCKLGPRNLF